jgi:hypothetical protein
MKREEKGLILFFLPDPVVFVREGVQTDKSVCSVQLER